MEIFLLLAYVFIVCRHIPLELYRFFMSTICWCKRCYMSFWCQQNVDAKDFIWVFGVNKMLIQKMYMSFWRQHNVDTKRCYIRFCVSKRLTLKIKSCCKKHFLRQPKWYNNSCRLKSLRQWWVDVKYNTFLRQQIFLAST